MKLSVSKVIVLNMIEWYVTKILFQRYSYMLFLVNVMMKLTSENLLPGLEKYYYMIC